MLFCSSHACSVLSASSILPVLLPELETRKASGRHGQAHPILCRGRSGWVPLLPRGSALWALQVFFPCCSKFEIWNYRMHSFLLHYPDVHEGRIETCIPRSRKEGTETLADPTDVREVA